jgi:hypothetical protein
MTSDKFRKMALEVPTAVERSHMNHPDFRVAGKIFASLGVPDESWGMVKLTPEQQRTFIEKAPEVFKPSSGAWGRQGYTNVYLPVAKPTIVRTALDAAAKNVASKNQRKRPRSNAPMIPIMRLRGGLKKRALESWLKRARVGCANLKLRSNFELGRAMNFHIEPSVFCQ